MLLDLFHFNYFKNFVYTHMLRLQTTFYYIYLYINI